MQTTQTKKGQVLIKSKIEKKKSRMSQINDIIRHVGLTKQLLRKRSKHDKCILDPQIVVWFNAYLSGFLSSEKILYMLKSKIIHLQT